MLSIVIITGLFLTYNLFISPKSPRASTEYKIEGKEVDISYYRPYKKDRLIFGEAADSALVPYGLYWRLGANLTTKIETKSTISFAGRELPSGAYGLYAYPNKENWVIVVHEKTGGFSSAEPNESGVIMKINTASQSLNESIEKFTIDFVDNYLRIRWDTTQVSIPIN